VPSLNVYARAAETAEIKRAATAADKHSRRRKEDAEEDSAADVDGYRSVAAPGGQRLITYGVTDTGYRVFLPRDALVHSAVLRLLSSVCLSVCPSVTIRYRDDIGWKSSKITSRPNSLGLCSG